MSGVIKMNSELCVGCGMCAKECPHHAITVENGKAAMVLDSCMECGHCVAICPKNAVTMNGYDMSEVLECPKEGLSLDAAAFLNSVKARRSIRHFKDTPIDRDVILQVIEAGRFTPTGSNKQRVRYIVANNPADGIEQDAVKVFQKLKSVARVIGKAVKLPVDMSRYSIDKSFFFHGAPTVIFVISDDVVDAALASTNMETMAEALGLGVLYGGLFVRAARMSKAIRKKLGLSKKEKVVTAIAIGYPNVKFKRTVPRKKADVQWM